MWTNITEALSQFTGLPHALTQIAPVHGGSINRTYRACFGQQTVFIKLNHPSRLGMFEAEAKGLKAMAATHTLRIPQVMVTGQTPQQAFLVLEYISLTQAGSQSSQRQLGKQLAKMHQATPAPNPFFGWHQDNTIGFTPQINSRYTCWLSFWKEARLGYQLALAKTNGLPAALLDKGEAVLNNIEVFFSGHTPQASLLHGDLWSGNYGFDEHGHPVLFDPATYYGDRETDLAMTELFGGFSSEFYHAYQGTAPLDTGYTSRKPLYNLYHLLNHFNLFGAGYSAQVETTINKILATP